MSFACLLAALAPAADIVQVSCACDHVPPWAWHVRDMSRRSLLEHPVSGSAKAAASARPATHVPFGM
jgi:hypothetical protein